VSDKAMSHVCYVALGTWLTIAACFERCIDIAFSGELNNLTEEQTYKLCAFFIYYITVANKWICVLSFRAGPDFFLHSLKYEDQASDGVYR